MKRKPTAYDRDQHQLICGLYKVSDLATDPGPTAFEAVIAEKEKPINPADAVFTIINIVGCFVGENYNGWILVDLKESSKECFIKALVDGTSDVIIDLNIIANWLDSNDINYDVKGYGMQFFINGKDYEKLIELCQKQVKGLLQIVNKS